MTTANLCFTRQIDTMKLEHVEELQRGRFIFECIARDNLIGIQQCLGKSTVGLEFLDNASNTPLLFASYLGRCHIVNCLLENRANYKRINVYGQDALSLATHSGDRSTCEAILRAAGGNIDEFNSICMLSPLCVAVLRHNYQLAQLYLELEHSLVNPFECPSQSVHGVCPLQLAQRECDAKMIELLKPKHHHHRFRMLHTTYPEFE